MKKLFMHTKQIATNVKMSLYYLNFKCGMCNTLISSYLEAVCTYISRFPFVKILPKIKFQNNSY